MEVTLLNRQKNIKINQKLIKKKTRLILKLLKLNNAAITIIFTNNNEIKKLNKKFRTINKSTDVLSFPTNDKYFIGDIVISLQKAKANSVIHKFSSIEEILFLIIHGILHLIGYEHDTKVKLIKLEKIQNKLFNKVI